MGFLGCGDSLVDLTEANAMWRFPFSIALEVKKTRTGWQVIVRVIFAR
jgi:hypothetical protein